MKKSIELTFTQCKQLAANVADIRVFLESVNDQPEFMQFEQMGVSSLSDLQSIIHSGCASNAHQSVFYYNAAQCMALHGDEVLEYIEDTLGELPAIESGTSWNQIASVYLTTAIELWCGGFAGDLDGVDWD
jgi:hypothetical protein